MPRDSPRQRLLTPSGRYGRVAPCIGGAIEVLIDLRTQQRFDRATLVHRAVALRHLIERQREGIGSLSV